MVSTSPNTNQSKRLCNQNVSNTIITSKEKITCRTPKPLSSNLRNMISQQISKHSTSSQKISWQVCNQSLPHREGVPHTTLFSFVLIVLIKAVKYIDLMRYISSNGDNTGLEHQTFGHTCGMGNHHCVYPWSVSDTLKLMRTASLKKHRGTLLCPYDTWGVLQVYP